MSLPWYLLINHLYSLTVHYLPVSADVLVDQPLPHLLPLGGALLLPVDLADVLLDLDVLPPTSSPGSKSDSSGFSISRRGIDTSSKCRKGWICSDISQY